MLRLFLGLPRRTKQLIAVSVDFILLILAFYCALSLRFDTVNPEIHLYRWQMLAAPMLAIPIFIWLGLYRAVIRYMEDRVVFVVAGGVILSVLLLSAGIALAQIPYLSRSVLGIYSLLAIFYIGATRFLARRIFLRAERSQDTRKRIVIYGAGSAGRQLAFALKAGRNYLPVAFFDDNPALQNIELAGLRVHNPEQISALLAAKAFDEILLALPSVSRARQKEILHALEHLRCKVRLVPGMMDIVNGEISLERIRDVDIEDLLGRDSVVAAPRLLGQCITDKVVLVSGAGGSIGSELCRQIIGLKPRRLVLMELSEFALYQIEQELLALSAQQGSSVEIIALLGSVTHQSRNERIMQTYGVQTVYHAAAYKHVPLVEHNPIEGVRNNAIGTQRMAQAALAAGVETFVLISTDKAVRPTNVMGASKRLAELVLQGLARTNSGATRFCMVRFGNVLGSSGSVVPLFRQQIAAGGPITLTHAEITRFFMTIPEAAQLVIQAGSMGQGGEVYVLDMGAPIRIIDLARRMVHLSGLTIQDENTPDGDIALEIVGLRPGEKLYEELLIGENVEGTSHPLILRAYEHELPWATLAERLSQLDKACQGFAYQQALDLLATLVTEYTPTRHDDTKLLWQALASSSGGKPAVEVK